MGKLNSKDTQIGLLIIQCLLSQLKLKKYLFVIVIIIIENKTRKWMIHLKWDNYQV